MQYTANTTRPIDRRIAFQRKMEKDITVLEDMTYAIF